MHTNGSRKTVLQLIRRYVGNYELYNQMAAVDPTRFRTIVCYLAGKPDGGNRIESIADKTLYLDSPRLHLKWVAPPISFKVRRIIEQEQADLVVCQARATIPFGVFGSLFSRRRPPVAGVMHGLPGGRARFKDKLWRWPVYQLVSKLVSVSESGIEDIKSLTWGLAREKMTAIRNGLDPTPFSAEIPREEARRRALPFLNGEFLFGTVGRLVEKKNHRTLLHAFRRVADELPETKLVIVGGGPLERSLHALANKLELNGHVQFVGVRRDVPVLLKCFDAFVFPTLREGLPLSLLEAMASGLPIIASDIGCIREVITSGAGRLVDPNDPDRLAAEMIGVARASEATRREMARYSRDTVLSNFTGARMRRDYGRLYDELLSRAGR